MLTKLAAFNMAAVFLDQLVVLLVALVLMPTIISTLGVAAFGVWQLITRWTSYVSLMDGRSHELLKWKISRESTHDVKILQQNVGAGLIVWLSYLPVLAAAGGLFLFWVLHQRFDDEIGINAITFVAIVMLINAALAGLIAFPEAILRGCNKGYMLIGARALVLLFVGALSVWAVKNGYGMAGLACVQVLGTIMLFSSYQYVAKKNVAWIGFAKPEREQVVFFYKAGFWYLAWSLVNFGFSSLDIIILGFFLSPDRVSVFVVTYFAVQTVTVAIATAISAVLPGMGALLRAGDAVRMSEVRTEGIIYCWWFAISISVTAILVNQAFVGLWVEPSVYAGNLENLFIVLMALQMVFIRIDSQIINILLDQKLKVQVTLLALVAVLVLSVFLVPAFDILGLCAAFILGRFAVLLYYPRIITKYSGITVKGPFATLGVQRCAFSVFLIVAYLYVSRFLSIEGWLELVLVAGLSFTLSIFLLYLFGFSKEDKYKLFSRMRSATNR